MLQKVSGLFKRKSIACGVSLLSFSGVLFGMEGAAGAVQLSLPARPETSDSATSLATVQETVAADSGQAKRQISMTGLDLVVQDGEEVYKRLYSTREKLLAACFPVKLALEVGDCQRDMRHRMKSEDESDEKELLDETHEKLLQTAESVCDSITRFIRDITISREDLALSRISFRDGDNQKGSSAFELKGPIQQGCYIKKSLT